MRRGTPQNDQDVQVFKSAARKFKAAARTNQAAAKRDEDVSSSHTDVHPGNRAEGINTLVDVH
ncbi:hypothetical protein PR001_g33749 [Phytophthora rubi]|uniref:Uncharacterized protein n=1 Tax=Phytophthora rubi TaxID=129364 RepID=A0A6A3FY68_9STRA|nr:hypothetical protein PR002_g33075 [Phytophthora rubi]KAE8951372.1 hypothetical protein PR001_g33749 [Phytophthora rubi]